MLMQKLLASAGGVDKLYIDDLFQAYMRTGTGASATVTTGINLSVKGGMIWSKGRSGATDHAIYDTTRGVTFDLASNLTSAQTTQAQGLTAFGATGHTWGTLAKVNTNAATYVDYVFAKAPKFFDVVTYTGNGVAGRQIPHALGIAPGMMIVKKLDSATDWCVYHKGINASNWMQLNQTSASSPDGNVWNNTEPTDTVYTLGNSGVVNQSGNPYVAYLFAHDPSADGLIQCGSFTTDGSGNATVSLGWEPQYLMYKRTDTADSWPVYDTMRGWSYGNDGVIYADSSNAEATTGDRGNPTATGFTITGRPASATYIYLAIRRPNKPPTTGTEVYNAIARTGTGAAATVTGVGFAPDSVMVKNRVAAGNDSAVVGRLTGSGRALITTGTAAELDYSSAIGDLTQDGVALRNGVSGFNGSGSTYINHFFKRAPGVFDVVCYTGTGVSTTIAHSLGVAPELMLVKSRSASTSWQVYHPLFGTTCFLQLNTNGEQINTTMFWDATPTTSAFTTNDYQFSNNATYVAYLFASKEGISKVGSYTGNGTSQTINCGFTTGARFILIKRTDSTGDWYVWDTVRGIIAGNDPYLCLNTTATEVTTNDSIDPDTSGFIVNQVAATNINVNAATYIFLSIA